MIQTGNFNNITGDAILNSINDVFPEPATQTPDSPRSPKFSGDLASTLRSLDLVAAGKVVVLSVVVLLAYDLLVYLFASTSSRKSLMVTPWLVQVLATTWDDLGHRGSWARSEDAVGPILRALSRTAAKYEAKWEKSRLL